ncbi:37S ribosomal protein S10, mitochondrial [Hypsizygus marmoreus]|uniref:Small ribosomal subunit protein uS10m n=1 Tax=Hypsizygus marmoreus TaxID=39966 RepID=A0A369JMH0_HYPMA|nr:37S ribosomal protein S10, mitochondrial [Hypsizygus marmoreus]
MLRLALARPSRAALPSVSRWTRFNSTGPIVPPPSSNASDLPSSSENAVAQEEKPALSKPVDPLFSAFSTADEPSYHDLEKELEGITEADLEASIKTPPKVAETEAELFGAPSPQPSGGSPKVDPQHLPLRMPLDPNVEITEEQYASTLVHGRGIHIPFFHPRTHDVPVANIQFRSHHPRLLDLFTHFATHAASSLGIPVSRVFYLPTKRTLWTVLRSPFVHKKSQENFERRVHKRAIKAWDADPEVVDRWCKYLRRHAMGGVGMRVTKWERMPLGVGASMLAKVEGQLEKPVQLDSQKIKALGEKIVLEEMAALKAKSDAPAVVEKQ